jgi:hypothetical protein
MAFAAIVIGNVGLILSNRSRQATLLETLRRPNPALGWIVGGALLGLALALYVEPMLQIFRFAPAELVSVTDEHSCRGGRFSVAGALQVASPTYGAVAKSFRARFVELKTGGKFRSASSDAAGC